MRIRIVKSEPNPGQFPVTGFIGEEFYASILYGTATVMTETGVVHFNKNEYIILDF